jgi:hypothetical protein
MASRRWVCHGPAKCLQTNDFRQARPRAGGPRIVRRCRGFRQGTDNERSLALGASAGSHVAVESARLRQSGSQIPAAPAGEGPRRTTPAAHRGRGSTSACPHRSSSDERADSAPADTCVSSGAGRSSPPRRALAQRRLRASHVCAARAWLPSRSLSGARCCIRASVTWSPQVVGLPSSQTSSLASRTNGVHGRGRGYRAGSCPQW